MVERVTFQTPAKIDDEGGGKKTIWISVFDLWAKIEPISSRELFFGMAIKAEVTHRVQIRFRSDIKNTMRIKHQDLYYKVDSIIDMAGRRRFLELLCIETKESGE